MEDEIIATPDPPADHFPNALPETLKHGAIFCVISVPYRPRNGVITSLRIVDWLFRLFLQIQAVYHATTFDNTW